MGELAGYLELLDVTRRLEDGLSVTPNPLSALSDLDVADIAIYLQMICGRSKLPTKGQGRAKLCLLGARVNVELGQRGLPIPTAPYRAPAKQAL